MDLTFEQFDGRGRRRRPVIDRDTGKEVGHVQSVGVGPYRVGGIHVSLFGGKYQKRLHSYDQCLGFVLSVQAVLNHMIWVAPEVAKATGSAAA